MPVNPIPAQYPGVTPYLIVRDATAAIAFYEKAFGAKLVMQIGGPGGSVGHAELQIGAARFMLSDEFPGMSASSPETLGGISVSLLLYVANCDEVIERALAAGAKLERPTKDQFYGDRSGLIIDPSGHKWSIATHIEDVSEEELQARAAKLFASSPSGVE